MQNIDEIRERIYSLLGKHLIRFQTIEMRLKSLVKMNRTIISKPNDLPLIIEPSVQNQTLDGGDTEHDIKERERMDLTATPAGSHVFASVDDNMKPLVTPILH